MKKLALIILGAALAASASAQAPASRGKSAVPTDADYRMRVIEPQPNATIVGKDIQVVVEGPRNPQGDRSPQNATDARDRQMNTPIFQVFVDGKSYGNLQDNQNVLVARDVAYGAHRIVVVAKNVAGEVIDRAEIPVSNVESGGASASTSSMTSSSTATRETAPPPPAPPSTSSSSGTTVSTPPSPPPPAPAETTLPKTASRAPACFLLGLLLLGGGLLYRRA